MIRGKRPKEKAVLNQSLEGIKNLTDSKKNLPVSPIYIQFSRLLSIPLENPLGNLCGGESARTNFFFAALGTDWRGDLERKSTREEL